MLKKILSKSYIYILLAIVYIPLVVGVIYSTSAGGKRADMPINYRRTDEGWKQLSSDQGIVFALLNSIVLALIVSLIVVAVSLLTVFSLWRQRNKTAKTFVNGTMNVPLINPDVITAISLSFVFGAMFGTTLAKGDTGYFRLVFAQVTMIIPYAITIMYPRSEKFKVSLMEASKDLGYGPIKTWLKTYFRHMIPVIIAALTISILLSLDDFIVTRIVSKETTIGRKMYEGSLSPWVLALGTILMCVTLGSTGIFAFMIYNKERRVKKGKALISIRPYDMTSKLIKVWKNSIGRKNEKI